jgi:hypothetical protein
MAVQVGAVTAVAWPEQLQLATELDGLRPGVLQWRCRDPD